MKFPQRTSSNTKTETNPFAKVGIKTKPKTKSNPFYGLKTKINQAQKADSKNTTKLDDSLIQERIVKQLAAIRKENIAALYDPKTGFNDWDNLSDQNPFHNTIIPNANLDELQQLAVKTSLDNQYMNLVGPAGSGKTFTLASCIYQLIETGKVRKIKDTEKYAQTSSTGLSHIGLSSNHYNIVCCAFTGMAVKNIQKNLPKQLQYNCATIHKTLDYAPEVVEDLATAKDVAAERAAYVGQIITKKLFKPRINPGNRIYPDLLIIDEASMLGLTLCEQLLTSISENTRIICVGDLAQLKPVMDTSVFPFTIRSWPTIELSKIYRQKEGDIIDAATNIRLGKKPNISTSFKAFMLDSSTLKSQRQIMKHVRKDYDKWLNDPADPEGYTPYRDIVLSPWNKDDMGTLILNTLIRAMVNSEAKQRLIKTQTTNYVYSVGDRIVCTKNNYHRGVFNGMLGTIVNITKNRRLDYNDEPDTTFLGLNNQVEINLDLLETITDQVPESYTNHNNEGDGSRKATHTLHIIFDQTLEELDQKWVRDTATTITDPVKLHETLSNPDNYPNILEPSNEYVDVMRTSSLIENLQLSYAVTVNRAQGSGFRKVFLITHRQHSVSLCNELLYTGVTRAIEKVVWLTDVYAAQRSLTRFTYNGNTLEDKVEAYASKSTKSPDWIPELTTYDQLVASYPEVDALVDEYVEANPNKWKPENETPKSSCQKPIPAKFKPFTFPMRRSS